ncbi:hypothetical protein DLAC_06257 [Tieghemostelium lacteum]|uniref:EamA domain-containing protein n=1 Tax=Tieghemostelium lacteum TaxID=361077 RepID=A0A151ZED5_TIELA|nr:hypothetical protein DLAC_06257 [Tieghemostelium lacteum]|eukprot:KYQ92295.1 hypothetical protein DLAC_06257 [Tieghemostelium lacteum]
MDKYETLIDEDEQDNQTTKEQLSNSIDIENKLTISNETQHHSNSSINTSTSNVLPLHKNSLLDSSHSPSIHHNPFHIDNNNNNNVSPLSTSTTSTLRESIALQLKQTLSPLKSPLSTFNQSTSSFLRNSTARFKSSTDSAFMQSLRSSTSRFLIGADITATNTTDEQEQMEEGDVNHLESIHGETPISVTPGHSHHSPINESQTISGRASLLLSSIGFDILNQSFGETGALLTFSSDNHHPLTTSSTMNNNNLTSSQMGYSHRRTNIPHNDKVSLLNSSTTSSVISKSSNNYYKIRSSSAATHQQPPLDHFIKSSTADGASILTTSPTLTEKEEFGSLDEIELDNMDTNDAQPDLSNMTVPQKIKHFVYEKRGLMFMVFSSFLFSIMALLVKVLSKELSSLEIGFLRSFYGFFACLIILRILNINPLGDKQYRHLLFIRGLSGTFSLIAYFLTLTVLQLSEAVIISFTSPVITAALAAIVLKEKWGKFEALCACLSLVGVVIVAKPAFLFHSAAAAGSDLPGTKKLIFYLIGLSGACFTAISYITVRKVGPGTNPFILVCYFSAVGSIVHFPAIFIFQKFVWPSWGAWGIITLMGIIAVIAQASVNRGLQLEKASKAAAMNYIQIVFTLIWELIFLHESVDLITLGGTALILSCSVINALKK